MGTNPGILLGLGIVYLVLGAVILLLACGVYNRLAGPSAGVPKPSFGKAIVITLLRMVVAMFLGMAVGFVSFGPGVPYNLILLMMYPVIFVVAACILTMLPTSLGRAFLVTLIEFGINLGLGMVLLILRMALGLGLGR
jgi:hypothetical protein